MMKLQITSFKQTPHNINAYIENNTLYFDYFYLKNTIFLQP